MKPKRCEAIASTGSQCQLGASQVCEGKNYCGHHFKQAVAKINKQVDMARLESGALLLGSREIDSDPSLELAQDIVKMVTSGMSVRTLALVLKGWKET